MAGELVTIDGITVRATLKDEPAFTVVVTEHAVEAGANVIDHARPKLVTLSIEGIVSEIEGDDPQAMHQFFTLLAQQPRPVTIVTPRTQYDAMLMTSYRPKREAKYGSALHFVTEWSEYRTANVLKQVVQVKRAAQVKKGRQSDHRFKDEKRSAASAVSGIGATKTERETRGKFQSGGD